MGDRAVRCTVLPSYVKAGDSLSGFKTFQCGSDKRGKIKTQVDPGWGGLPERPTFALWVPEDLWHRNRSGKRSLDARTDIYALGRTLQWILRRKKAAEKKKELFSAWTDSGKVHKTGSG